MQTNKIFNIHRFGHLLKADILLNHRRYLFMVVGAIIVFYLIFLMNMSNDRWYGKDNYGNMFILFVMGLGVFVGTAFPELKNKISTGNYLLLPASTFEKFLSQFLIRFVIGSIVFLLIFWVSAHLSRFTALRIADLRMWTANIESFNFSMLSDTLVSNNEKYLIVTLPLSMLAFMFAGRLFFKSQTIVKTLSAGVVISFTITCFVVLMSHIFYPETKGFNIELPTYRLFKNVYNTQYLAYVISYTGWIFFLLIAYFKLKEKQV